MKNKKTKQLHAQKIEWAKKQQKNATSKEKLRDNNQTRIVKYKKKLYVKKLNMLKKIIKKFHLQKTKKMSLTKIEQKKAIAKNWRKKFHKKSLKKCTKKHVGTYNTNQKFSSEKNKTKNRWCKNGLGLTSPNIT